MTKVSVVIPTRNRASTIARAVRSVLAQTHRDLELLVVDDGSDDGTSDVLARFDDPRMRVVVNPGPHGAAAARNFGAQQASGDWLAFQDSDDEWLVDKLYRQLRDVQRCDDVDLLCCGYLVVPHDSNLVRYQGATPRMQSGQWDSDNIYDFSFITPTWLLRRETFERLGGFDDSMPNLEDWEFSFRLYKQARIRVLNEPLVVKHGAADSLNWDPVARRDSVRTILQRHDDLWSAQPAVKARLLRELGHWCAVTGDMDAARAQFIAAWRLAKGSLRNVLLVLASLGGSSTYAALRSVQRASR